MAYLSHFFRLFAICYLLFAIFVLHFLSPIRVSGIGFKPITPATCPVRFLVDGARIELATSPTCPVKFGAFVWRNPNLFWTKLTARFARQTERSGGPHSKAFGLLRGKQKARIFVYPVGKRSFSFGARPRLPRSERKAFYYWGFPPPPNFVFENLPMIFNDLQDNPRLSMSQYSHRLLPDLQHHYNFSF